MAEIMYWEAIMRAHDEEMTNDPMVIAMRPSAMWGIGAKGTLGWMWKPAGQ